jgi:hypothetical protein
MSETVLLIGNNIRNVAESARKAGYDVLAVTKFVDADLKIYCKKIYRIEDSWEEARVRKLVEDVSQTYNAPVILGSGYETLNVDADLLCSDPRVCRRVVDKLKFYRTLERAGIPHPRVLKDSEDSVGVRTIKKPRTGGGGEGITFSTESAVNEGFILQEYIPGTPCSVSLLVSEKRVTPVACNLVLVGWREMNADNFRYAGNITPLEVSAEVRRELENLAVETVELFDLIGSVGVDFILAEKPYVLEINPRFQGSLDSIEWSCDLNLFRLHVVAIEGREPKLNRPVRYASRTVLFSNQKITIRKKMAGIPFFADIPSEGDTYNPRDPLVSILAAGKSVEEVIQKTLERKEFFWKLM